ncbi:MAG TPA: hypothetical protein P5267_00295 [Patescibacteria group bacterium]|nr:hypothetical protein [Patescibacteria group bacterium]
MNKLWFLGGFFALALVLSVFAVVSAAGPSQQPAVAQLRASNVSANNIATTPTCACGADAPCGGNCGANGKTCQCGGACRMNQNAGQ